MTTMAQLDANLHLFTTELEGIFYTRPTTNNRSFINTIRKYVDKEISQSNDYQCWAHIFHKLPDNTFLILFNGLKSIL